jgi:mRNA-degrading endonuclease RelE of RelBE toxin-antitoxin system
MDYTIAIMPRAEKDLRKLPRDIERRIVTKVAGLADDLKGDVKRLTDRGARVAIEGRRLSGAL